MSDFKFKGTDEEFIQLGNLNIVLSKSFEEITAYSFNLFIFMQ